MLFGFFYFSLLSLYRLARVPAVRVCENGGCESTGMVGLGGRSKWRACATVLFESW